MPKKLTAILLIFSVCASISGNMAVSGAPSNAAVTLPADFVLSITAMQQGWIVRTATNNPCNLTPVKVNMHDGQVGKRFANMSNFLKASPDSTNCAFINWLIFENRTYANGLLTLSKYYFPVFEQQLKKAKLPSDLKYLPAVVSALHIHSTSRNGNAGIWQLSIPVGRMYGLEINSLVDERFDPVLSGAAAVEYLRDLYAMYADWSLVVVAYTAGPGNLNKAIRRANNSRNPADFLPFLATQVQGYLKLFPAIQYVIQHASLNHLCKADIKLPLLIDTVQVTEKMHFQQISSTLNIPIELIRVLNPRYVKDFLPGNIASYPLLLPFGMVAMYHQSKAQIVAYKPDTFTNTRREEVTILDRKSISPTKKSTPKHTIHIVKSGQTLGGIADRYNVPLTKLKKWNNIRGNIIRPGQKLKILK